MFLQYLFSLAVVEAVKSCEGCAGLPVFIKWPNDVYAKLPAADGQTELKKLGGLLVNSTFSGNEFLLVFGQGLNVANARPSSCLNAVLDAVYPNGLPKGVSYFRQETLLATILARFRDLYYNHYLPRGFRAVEGRYLSHWLHSDQQVGVENEGQVKIRGINEDGELVVEKLEGGGRLCLGPDGNGFDMMRNLLVQKHQS